MCVEIRVYLFYCQSFALCQFKLHDTSLVVHTDSLKGKEPPLKPKNGIEAMKKNTAMS